MEKGADQVAQPRPKFKGSVMEKRALGLHIGCL